MSVIDMEPYINYMLTLWCMYSLRLSNVLYPETPPSHSLR